MKYSLSLNYKRKHEKFVRTPFPRVPTPLHLWVQVRCLMGNLKGGQVRLQYAALLKSGKTVKGKQHIFQKNNIVLLWKQISQICFPGTVLATPCE